MKLSETLILPRASQYTNPLNGNDAIPYVYGDLTDGASGNWQLPCIDTVNHVYAYAGFDVLSVAEGNSITMYKDGVVVSSGYTFNGSNNYESKGNIATITFTTDQGNYVIGARGKGRDSLGVLIENVIDQIYDLLVNIEGYDSTEFDDTTKSKCTSIFTSQGYKAAGVIDNDISYWSLLQKMMSSFYGYAYRNSSKKLAFIIDNGTINQYTQIDRIDKRIVNVTSAERTSIDIINRCPIHYGHDYINQRFKYNTDNDAHVNITSQNKFGEQKPKNGYYQLYWCRDQTTAEAIQALIINDYKNPNWTIEIKDDSYQFIHAEPFDILCLSIDWLYNIDGSKYVNQFFKILDKTVNLEKMSVILKLKDTGAYLTTAYIADGTYIADGSILSGGTNDTTNYLSG